MLCEACVDDCFSFEVEEKKDVIALWAGLDNILLFLSFVVFAVYMAIHVRKEIFPIKIETLDANLTFRLSTSNCENSWVSFI